jgi:hypothetical protein
MAFGAMVAPRLAENPPEWTDHYNPSGTRHNVNSLAALQPEVRTLLPQLREGAATLVAGVRVTPRILQYLSQLMDREIGLLTDTQGRGTLYLTLGGPTGISTPQPKASYRFLAHTHPTISAATGQITRDMANASDHVEIVVTMSNLILYYDTGRCYNSVVSGAYMPRADLLNLDSVLDVAALAAVTDTLHRERDAQIEADRQRLLERLSKPASVSGASSSQPRRDDDEDDDIGEIGPLF